MTSQNYLAVAIEAAQAAGEILIHYFYNDVKVETKSTHHDLVTQADKESEIKIIDLITTEFPEHEFLAEESNPNSNINHDTPTWIIDPLDGTSNFSHRIPHFCISIGLVHNNQTIIGVIYDPIRDELYTATNTEPAKLNNDQISVSKTDNIKHAALATGFPYDRQSPEFTKTYQLMQKYHKEARAMRRLGSAALDLAYLAAGRFDGFFEYGLKPWDTTAGILLVKQANGRVQQKINPSFIRADNGILDWT